VIPGKVPACAPNTAPDRVKTVLDPGHIRRNARTRSEKTGGNGRFSVTVSASGDGVVCQSRPAERCPDLFQTVQQAIALVMPVFERTARRRNKLLTPLQHRGGCLDPFWHPFEDVLVDPPGHAAPRLMAGIARLHRTGATRSGRLGAKRPPTLDGRTAAGPRLSGVAAGAVVGRSIGERRLRRCSRPVFPARCAPWPS
jgi:hypothetical protein